MERRVLINGRHVFVPIRVTNRGNSSRHGRENFRWHSDRVLLVHRLHACVSFRRSRRLFRPKEFLLLILQWYFLLSEQGDKAKDGVFNVPFLQYRLSSVHLISEIISLLEIGSVRGRFKVRVAASATRTSVQVDVLNHLLRVNSYLCQIPIVSQVTSSIG